MYNTKNISHKNFQRLCYEIYKNNWMEAHTTSSSRVKEYISWVCNDPDCTFAEYESRYGYDGEIFSSFDEFLTNEYRDIDTMKSLLDEHLFATYLYHRSCAGVYHITYTKSTGNPNKLYIAIIRANSPSEAQDLLLRKYAETDMLTTLECFRETADILYDGVIEEENSI